MQYTPTGGISVNAEEKRAWKRFRLTSEHEEKGDYCQRGVWPSNIVEFCA
jgi:hypothetical protein